MTSRQDWPKPDLLQQRLVELGLPSEPGAVGPVSLLLLKGAVLGVVLLCAPVPLWLLLVHQQRRIEVEVITLAPVEVLVGETQAKLKTMTKFVSR